jgi:hypothetical protein
LHAAWAFASPYDGPPDEEQHVMHAYAVVHGQLLPSGTGDVESEPNSLFRPFCFPQKIDVAANCTAEPGGDTTVHPRWVSEARFNPIYYAVTGWPIGLWPNWRGIMLGRLLTGALMAGLLACAVVAAVRWTRHRAVLAGLVVAITPMVASLGGSYNPNGVEIAAAVALFAGMIAVIHEQRAGINRAAVALVGVSASILATPRFLGVMWVAIIIGAVMIPMSKARLRELAKSWIVRRWAGLIVLAWIASAAWTLIAGTAGVGSANLGYTPSVIIKGAVLGMWPNVVDQMVGVMGWAETLQPRLIYVAWFMAAGLLLIGPLILGKRVDRWRMLALTAATFVPLLGAEMVLVNDTGWFNQGRYFLPGAVGLPMIGALIMARRGLTADHVRTMTRLLAVVLLPIQFVCLVFTMCRWQSGEVLLNPFKGSWLPPYGAVLPLVCGLLGVLVQFFMYWRAARVPAAPQPAIDADTGPVDAGSVDAVTERVQAISV